MTDPRGPAVTRVERVMGTAFSITVCDDDPAADAVADAFAWLHRVDATFSTYRDNSEICRLDRGELDLDDASPEVREVLVGCDELTARTDGWFRARTADGHLDPSGLVKGWSIDRAADLLRMAGCRSFSVNGGGDIVCQGRGPGGGPWRTGVRHPHRVDAVAAVLDLDRHAIATSGTYERGDHIWSTRPVARSLVSVTVVGPELATADALATAVFAEGSGSPAWLDHFGGYERLLVTADDQVRWTPGLDRLKVASPAA